MKIAILGDLFVPQPEQVIIDDSVKDVLSSCDYRIINMEASIDDGKNNTVKKSGPIIKHPESIVRILSELRIDALTLANNHIMDAGESGFHYTKKKLKNYLLMGAGRWEDAYQLHVIENNGLKIGFLNLCEMQFGMLYDKWNQGNDSIGCAWVNHPSVNPLIINSKKVVDKLIVICHAGVENIDIPLPEWRDRYREMVDLGCDAIVAHHPHIVQGYELYKGAPICYSLGNFCFSNDSKAGNDNWNTGAIAILNIDKSKVGLAYDGIVLHDNRVSIIKEDKWTNRCEALCAKLGSEEYITCVNEACLSLLDSYWQLFAMGGLFNPRKMTNKNLGRILTGRYSNIHLLNNLQCESHRWCVSRGIRLLLGL